ncbi:hypothetical protein KACHI17_25440 [Sediminibacterium sp. KACHI17]|uniref:Outer membrane protein beta-barrel domain-containing protein n=1 Tax=Sediminibacterium sp. KACHI17 TaxID=1751071 RepID=A0AAT9GLX1_9BACT
MKKGILFAFLVTAAIAVNAQSKSKIKGLGAGMVSVTNVDGKMALNIGGYGGILINDKWTFGASGNNFFLSKRIGAENRKFQFSYYGLYNEYRFGQLRNVHISAGITTGIGALHTKSTGVKPEYKLDGKWTPVVQPKLILNIPVTSFMQVQVHGSYLMTGKTNNMGFTKQRMNGVDGGISLLFGGL